VSANTGSGHGNAAAGRVEDGRGAPRSRPTRRGVAAASHIVAEDGAGAMPHPPSPDTRTATAPALAQQRQPTPATAREGTVRVAMTPAIRAGASYRVAALAGPCGASRGLTCASHDLLAGSPWVRVLVRARGSTVSVGSLVHSGRTPAISKAHPIPRIPYRPK
jgi:hypothetical protein